MALEGETNTQRWHNLTLHCPVCGHRLELKVIDIADHDPAEVVWLLLLDCPAGDFHGALTQHEVAKITAAEVMRRLRGSG